MKTGTTSPERVVSPDTTRTARPGLRRWQVMMLALLGAVGGAYGALAAGMVYLRWLRPPTTMVQAQRRVESWFAPGPYRKQTEWRPLAQLGRRLPHAVIAAEDTGFYEHEGIDWDELEKAFQERRRGGMRGASTISQQLVKNLYFTTHRNPVRKIAEFALVPALETILPKDRILELYLNVVEWGPGVYGAEAAARYHYRTSAARLTRDQASRLAAILPAPRRRNPARAGRYAAIVQQRMSALGW
ncbi:MAG: monofunctional biosynthetic peptidoglycan transglycosylase [Bryobacteraceae bacterium]